MNEVIIPKTWSEDTYLKFQKSLYTVKDEKYYQFNKKIVFTNYEMIGIRVPLLRKIAKKIEKTRYDDFLKTASLNTYEEIFIYGVVISYIKDYNTFLNYFKKFIKYIDNWAICDMALSSFKIIKKNKDEFEEIIQDLLKSKREYYVRVGIVSLLYYYIEKEQLKKLYNYLDSIKHEGYYVHMAIAWAISIIYIKFPAETKMYLKNNKLSTKTLNKAIQKIRESTRVDNVTKQNLLLYKK